MSESLLEVKDLKVVFQSSDDLIKAVNGVSFSIKKGETMALVGESGSGKSVTALSILQLLSYPSAQHSDTSSIKFKDEEIIGAGEQKLRAIRGNRISMIFQDPMTSLNPLHEIEKQISESLSLGEQLGAKQVRKRCIELLELVGIKDPETRLSAYPHQLSGGQRQRVMIAMALANHPDLLIADEPTTALDVTVQAQILNLLKHLQKKLGMAILLITHDLSIVKKVADKVAVMIDGEIVETNSVTNLFAKPKTEYTRKLINSEPTGEPPPISENARPILEVKDLRVWFPIQKGILKRTVGYIKAVNGVTLSIKEGETLGVVGESGSGKTTLGMAILRLQSSEGDIIYRERPIHKMSYRKMIHLRSEMQVVFQDPFGSLNPRKKVLSIIAEPLDVLEKVSSTERKSRVVSTLESVGLKETDIEKYPHEFSGGQRQRIAIARALITKPQIIVADEPVSALDVSVQAQVLNLLQDLQDKLGVTYILISHDLAVVKFVCDDVIVMNEGKIVEEGSTKEIFSNPKHEYTKTLLDAVPRF